MPKESTHSIVPLHATKETQDMLSNLAITNQVRPGPNGLHLSIVFFGEENKNVKGTMVSLKEPKAQLFESIQDNGDYNCLYSKYPNNTKFEQVNDLNTLAPTSYTIKTTGEPGLVSSPDAKLTLCENVPLTSGGFSQAQYQNWHLYYNREPKGDTSPVLRGDDRKSPPTHTATLVQRDPKTGKQINSFKCNLDAEGKPIAEPGKETGTNMMNHAIKEVLEKAVQQRELLIKKPKTASVDQELEVQNLAASSPSLLPQPKAEKNTQVV